MISSQSEWVFMLRPTDQTLAYTVFKAVMTGGTYVGANHCQDGSGERVHTLYPVRAGLSMRQLNARMQTELEKRVTRAAASSASPPILSLFRVEMHSYDGGSYKLVALPTQAYRDQFGGSSFRNFQVSYQPRFVAPPLLEVAMNGGQDGTAEQRSFLAGVAVKFMAKFANILRGRGVNGDLMGVWVMSALQMTPELARITALVNAPVTRLAEGSYKITYSFANVIRAATEALAAAAERPAAANIMVGDAAPAPPPPPSPQLFRVGYSSWPDKYELRAVRGNDYIW